MFILGKFDYVEMIIMEVFVCLNLFKDESDLDVDIFNVYYVF